MNRYKFIDEKGEHLHTLDEKPLLGTSTVTRVISKPLSYWASGKAVECLGWTNPKSSTQSVRVETALEALNRIKEMSVVDFIKLLDKAYHNHKKSLDKSADQGTDLHAELEAYVKEMIETVNGEPRLHPTYSHPAVKTFADWAFQNVKRFISSEGHCYSEELWTGGIVDLLFEDTQGRLAIMDFKSAKEAYLSHFIQIAGYDIELTESGVLDKDGNQVLKLEKPISYYAVFPFGMEKPTAQLRFDTKELKEGFKHAVALYKLININE